MELHGVAHDVGHLVVSPVVHALHRVQYSALHGFQSVLDMRHGTFENHIRGVVQKPVLIHAAQMVYHRGVEPVHGLIVRMTLRALWGLSVFGALSAF